MRDQFTFAKDGVGTRPPPKRSTPRRDHLIGALWSLLDGTTLAALNGVEKSVLLCVAAWARWDNGEVTLSRTSLARHTGHGERTCRRAIESLVARGILDVARSGAVGRGHATVYRIPKRGSGGPEIGVRRSRNRGAQTPPNRDNQGLSMAPVADATVAAGVEARGGGGHG